MPEHEPDCRYIRCDAVPGALMGGVRYYPWTPKNEADWILIAAAPELLAALKSVVDIFGSNAPHDFDVCEDSSCGCVRQLARAVIEKAEGR